MKLKWEVERMDSTRMDLNLLVNGLLVGFFRYYRTKNREWANCSVFINPISVKNLSLKDAKVVIEAMVRLEGG